ncbi:autotransporter-associated beta strand repeat-containing protein [Brucella tritici]|uniref:autotransporter-associated beta strand repeat-containing protein n=1 Tax=Brucella tritici TaxID=94626 RepID=UPI001592AAE5|nr:autotransporter-associated beta strand repeat-containing protein [Brucella tritici]
MIDCCFAEKFRDENNRTLVPRELEGAPLPHGIGRVPWDAAALSQTGKASGRSLLAQVALVLALSVSGLALSSHRAAATDYTTTQTNKNLADGDTITTSGDGFVVSSGTYSALGNNTIKVTGSTRSGIYVNGSSSTVNAFGTTIIATANGGYGVTVAGGGTANLENVSITTSGAAGIQTRNENSTLNVTGANTIITATGGDGILINASKNASIADGVTIKAKSAQKNGVTVVGGGQLTVGAANISAEGVGGYGLYASGEDSSIAATGTQIETKGATGTAAGVVANSGATISLSNVHINTVSSSGHGVWIDGAGSNVDINAGTSISTAGASAYGVLLENGATKTFTTGNSADAMPGSISVLGDGSAAFGTYGSGSKITFDGIDFPTATAITLGANAWTVIAGNSGQVEFKGNTAATNTKLLAQGSGALLFTGAATATGARIKTDGTDSSFDISGSSRTADFSVGSLEGTNGKAVLGANSLTIDGATSTSFGGVISGTGGLVRGGTGTTTLSGTNTYSGGTTFAGGVLSVSADAGLGNATGGLTFNGGTLQVTGTTYKSTSRALTWGAGGGTLDIATAGNTFTVSQNLGAGGALTKSGAGTLVLSGTNAYTGGTNINGGVLSVGSNANLGAASGALSFNGGTLRLSSAFDNARGVTLGAGGGTIETATGKNTFSGAISGAGGLTKTGAGTMILTGADTATGLTTVAAGTLQIGNGGGSGSIAGNIANSGSIVFNRSDALSYGGVISGGGTLTKSGAGTLTLTADQTYTGITTISTGILQVGNGATAGWLASNSITNNGTLSFNRSDSKTYSGNISGTGSVQQNGNGTLILSGTNSYSGGTTISAGTLQVASDDKLGVASGKVTLDGGTLNLAGAITSGRAYTVTSRNGTIDTGTNTDTISGVVSGAGRLTKAGSGTLVLTGTNSYSGGTTISAGILQLGNGGASGSISGDVANNGTLIFNRGVTSTFSGVVSGAGSLKQSGTGRTILTGANTYTGDTVIDRGVLQVGDGGASGTISNTVTNNGSLEFNRSGSYTYAGKINGTGSLKQTGTGTLILTGDSAYTGLTTIESGTLQLGSGGTSGSLNSDIVNNAALVVDRSDDLTYGKTINGSGTFEKRGTGKLTVTGDNDYTGGTTISAGILQIGNGGGTGSINGDIVNNSALIVDRSNNIDFTHVFSGTGTLEKQGTGILTMSGDNSAFTGTTTVSAGGLVVDGNLGSGEVTVSSGASLGGTGTIGGNTTIGSGGILVGMQGATLDFGSNLTLASGGVLNVSYGAPSDNTDVLFNVGGNLSFNNNVVNISSLGGFGPGQYSLFHAGGSVSGTLNAGSLPQGVSGTDITFNYAGNDVYLTNSQGVSLGYWDGSVTSAGGSVTGGDGTWDAAATNWTDEDGNLHAGWNSAHYAIFAGQSGKVTVSGPINATGMQFVTSGYSVVGDGLTLDSGSTDAPIIRVGNGVTASTTATIGSVLSGTNGMEKTDLGTLILAADNNYTGQTTIQAGTLQLGDGGASGSVVGGITIGRPGEDDDAVLAIDHSGGFALNNKIDGRGKLVQQGEGATTLAGVNTYSGGTEILGGSLIVAADNNLGNVAGAVNIDGGTLQFAADLSSTRGYTIGTNGGTIDTGANTDTITGVIGGTGQFNKSGTGTLILGGDNTFTGDLHVNAGTLQISDNSNLGNPDSHLYVNDATLLFGDDFTMTHDLTLGGAGATIDLNGHDNSISGVIDGGKLTKTGAGTLTLTGTNTYTGDTEIDGGTLAVLEDANLGQNVGNSIIIGNATLRLDEDFDTARNISLTDANSAIDVLDDGFNRLTGVLSGSGALNKTGTGTLVLGGTNTYQGGTDIQSGILQVSDDGNLGVAAGALQIRNGAELQFSQGVTSARSITLGTTGSIIDTMAGTSTLNGVVSGGELHKTGSGTLVLAGNNSYSGTFIDGGTVEISADANLGAANGTVTFNGGTLQFAADVSVARAMTINNAGGVINTQGHTGTLGGVFSGAGELTKRGSGTLVLTNGGNSYSGGTSIEEGTLRLSGAGWITGDVTNSGTLEFASNGTHDFSGVISGTGSVVQSGAGSTITLSGRNTYGGGTSITAGTLAISEDDNLGTGGLTIANGGVLQLNDSFAFTHAVVLDAGGTIDTGANDNTLAAVISGAGGLTKTGSGKLTLSGNNSYSDGTVIKGGILQIDADTNLGAANGSVTMANGTTLELTNDIMMNRAFTLDGDATIQTDDGTSTISGVIDGNGGLAKTGVGTLVLNGINTYKGDTSIDNGVLQVDSDDNLGDAASQLSFNGGELQITGSDFSSSRNITLETGGGTIDTMLNSPEIAGNITGAGSLTKVGEGKLTLSGDSNAYSGGTFVEQGTLQVGSDDGQHGSITGDIENNGTLIFSRNTLAYAGNIAGSGKLEQAGIGTTTLTGSVDVAGGTTVDSGGTLQVGDGTTNGSLKGNVVNHGTLAFNATANSNINFDDILSGDGTLDQKGAGSLTLTADSSGFDGATHVDAGTLYVNATLGSSSSTMTVATGGSLAGDGTIGGDTTVAGTLIGEDGKTLTFGGGLTMQAGSTINVSYGAPNDNGLFDVHGALALNGSTVNITDFGGFGPGSYRLFDYQAGYTKTGTGLTIGNVPGGTSADAYIVYDDTLKQINIMNSAGADLNTWKGGSGTWNQSDTSWHDASNPSVTGAWKNYEYAIFNDMPGTVVIDTGIQASGMQFQVDGYSLTGTNSLTLAHDPNAPSSDKPIIRVGDASDAGKSMTATIAAPLAGTAGLRKTDYGTLVLTGANTYTGGTDIYQGTLELGDGGSIATAGGISVDAQGTDKATFAINKTGSASFDGVVSGAGQFAQKGAGETTLTANNTYSGGTLITGGTLAVSKESNLGAAAGQVTIDGGALKYTTGFASNRAIVLGANNGTIETVDTANAMTINGSISGAGGLTKSGAGTLVLTKDNNYSGNTTVLAGTLQIGDDHYYGWINGAITNNGVVAFNRSDSVSMDKAISGTGSVEQIGSGTLTLSGTNTYSGGTTISAGILKVASDSNLGAASGALTINDATFENTAAMTTGRAVNVTGQGGTFQTNGDLTLTGAFDASGASYSWSKGGTANLIFDTSATGDVGEDDAAPLIQQGRVIVKGNMSGDYLVVAGGSLEVTGRQNGDITVSNGGMLMGGGSIGKSVTLTNNSTLQGASGQTMTIGGNLTLNSQADINVTLGLPSSRSLFDVQGDLTLDGTLNVTDGGGFGAGVYRLIDYDGNLIDNTLVIGTAPGDASRMWIDTDTANKHVNLMNASGVHLNVWEGQDNGTWNLASDHSNDVWTDNAQNIKGPYDQGSFAVFGGTAQGTTTTVNIDNSAGQVTAAGINFATDGYVLKGDALNLDYSDQPIIRVGDGSDAGKSMTATIEAKLTGTKGINKTDYGTLILTGNSDYTGGTTVTGGVLQIGNGGMTGGIEGNVNLVSDPYGHGTLAFDRQGSTTFGGDISGVGDVVQKGSGTTTFSGDNNFTGGLTVENGTAQAGVSGHAFGTGVLKVKAGAKADLNDLDTTVGGLTAFDTSGAVGDGDVTLGSGHLTVEQNFDSRFAGVISGTGGFTKSGAADLTLTGSNQYSGVTLIDQGTLTQGSESAFSSASAYTTARNGTLDLGGYDTTIASLDNAGTVNLSDMAAGTTLTVVGSYTGSNGTLVINTVLGDDNSKSDRLKVSGDTAGTTNLKVINRGGLGGQTVNGIEVVDVAGQSNGTFSLVSDYTTKDNKKAIWAGAYAYTLQQGSGSGNQDGNWYLVSRYGDPDPVDPNQPTGPRYGAGVPVYQGYAQNMEALNQLPTLQERVGNRYWTGENGDGQTNGAMVDGRGVWARIEGAHNRLEPQSATGMKQDINTFIMQAGVDGQFYEDDNGKLVAGITGQYGTAHGRSRSFFGDGYTDTNAWSLGATATWYGNNGFYVDTQGQLTWFDNDLSSDDMNSSLADGAKAFGYAMSVEAGQRVAIDDHWSLTPQAQLMWSSLDADAFQDVMGNRVGLDNANSLTARLGLAANYRNNWTGEDGRMVNTSVYGIANLYQSFLGGTTVNVAGVDIDTDTDKTWAGIGGGGTYAWSDNKYAVYGEGSINTSLNHFANSYALKATVGFKIKW